MVIPPRTWIELSASALKKNLRAWQSLEPKTPIMPIVKANAYGHGLHQIVPLLAKERIWGFGVAYDEEALLVRKMYHGRILALSFWRPALLPLLARQGIEVVVWDDRSLQVVKRFAGSGRTIHVHLKLDTGTSRIGFLPAHVPQLARELKQTSRLKVVGVFSHLANAEEKATSRTTRQIERFTTLLTPWTGSGLERHLACTAAILRYPKAKFDLLRLGIGLYGLWPSPEVKDWFEAHQPRFRLEPVLSWFTRLEQVKTVSAGTAIGYGSTVVVGRSTRLGIVPVGYADGYDRRASNTGWVIVNGRRAPILGRVAMNLMMLDLQAQPKASVGDRVTLLGEGVKADDLSSQLSILNYELISRLHPAIQRQVY